MKLFRRQYFIYPEIQKLILIQIVLGVVLLSILQIFCIYLSVHWLEQSTKVNLSILVDARVLGPWKKLLFLSLIIPLMINVILSVMIALFVSNKFAGPIYRIEKEIDTYLKNSDQKLNPQLNAQLNIQLRKNDYLKSLAHKINRIAE